MISVMALGLAGISPEARSDVVLASNLPAGYTISSFNIGVGFAGSTSNGVFTNEAAAQQFTAQAGGKVTTLITTVDQFQPGDVSLNVSIFAAAGSLPGALSWLGPLHPRPSFPQRLH
jgi:hypothetical protein